MKLALSTNWCNLRLESGEAIADKALELGFDELELGYHTSLLHVPGFKRRLDQMPVGSVHAFAPVPLSAPQGYPELYPLASFDADAARIAHLNVVKNVSFAAEMGADTVVLHAGRVMCRAWTKKGRAKKREQRGLKLLDIFRRELAEIVPVLEKARVVLALENLPYYEGFPNESELAAILKEDCGGWVKGWFDTGHHLVRRNLGWIGADFVPAPKDYAGMHLNDVVDTTDDHLAPGMGKVDFAALRPLAEGVSHRVFEPNSGVSEADLRAGLALIRKVWP